MTTLFKYLKCFVFIILLGVSNYLYAEVVTKPTIELATEELVQLYYNFGVSLSYNNEYDKAIEQFEQVININNDNADAHYNLAYLSYYHSKNLLKAHEHFQKYLELKPDARELSEISRYLGEIEVTLWLDTLIRN